MASFVHFGSMFPIPEGGCTDKASNFKEMIHSVHDQGGINESNVFSICFHFFQFD